MNILIEFFKHYTKKKRETNETASAVCHTFLFIDMNIMIININII